MEDTVRLQQVAVGLLLPARLDAGERPGAHRVDPAVLLREEVAQRAGDRLPVEVTAAEGLEVVGSRGRLARGVGNLPDNAQRHAATSVTASVWPEAYRIVPAVADDGSGVPEQARGRIFERFVRLDDAPQP